MDDGKRFGRGISFPPRLGADGRWAWSEGPTNIEEMIRVILLTGAQERVMKPAFGAGLRTFLFAPNTVTTHRLIQERIKASLTRWEPRIKLDTVRVEVDPDDPEGAVVTVMYRLVATGESRQAAVAIQLSTQET